MQCFLETLIYLLAIFGILFTSITMIEMFNYNFFSSYKICSKKERADKKVEIIVNLCGLDKQEEDEVIEILLDGKYDKLEDVVDIIRVEKEN